MANRTMLYHPTNAPNGQIFDLDKHPVASLRAQGYVDNPAKFGHDIWNTKGSAERVATVKQLFETGHVDAIEDENAPPTPHQAEHQARLESQLQEMLRKLEFYKSLAQPLTPAQEASMLAEREADMKSDAAKLNPPQVRGPGDEESDVSKQMREQDAQAQLEMQREEEQAAKEAAELAAQSGHPSADPTSL